MSILARLNDDNCYTPFIAANDVRNLHHIPCVLLAKHKAL